MKRLDMAIDRVVERMINAYRREDQITREESEPTAKDRQEEMAAFNALGDAPDFEAAVTDFEAQWGTGEFGRLTALRVREMQKQGAR